jgi:hypothetical protein
MRKLTDEETFRIVDAARSGYAMDSMLEVDLNAKLSMGEDAQGRVDGCSVQAWVWVNFEDAGIEVGQGAQQ